MCGIAGVVKFSSEKVVVDKLKTMTNAILHRGPDGEGQWINEDGNVGLGHRRLSIIDLSTLGHQPMHYLGRYSITFNGEIYNYLELKEILLQKGYTFKSHSDTEVLMALYDHYKEKALEIIDGMFAFAIYDNKENLVFCARDRFGEKPFFYQYQHGKEIVFASEMKAIHALNGKGSVSSKMLYNYLAFGYLDNRTDLSETFYEDIKSLPHSHYLLIDLKKSSIELKQYWAIQLESNMKMFDSKEQAAERIQELFTTGLKRRLRSDVSVGSSLSGGLDSSIIVCAIDQIFKQKSYEKDPGLKQKTFSARFPGFARDEGKFIDMITGVTDVDPYYTYPDEETLLNEIDKVAYHQEEPFGSASILAQYEVMKLAKANDVTVLLDGQGADEIFAGYHGYYNVFFREMRKKGGTKYAEEFNAYQKLHADNHINTKAKKDLAQYAREYFPSYVDKLRFGRVLWKQKTKKYFNNDFFQDYSRQYYRFNNSFNTLNGELNYSAMSGDLQVLLRYADRNSMAHSREVRLPFLFHELVNYAFSLPSQYKIHKGWTKWILRSSFNHLLPDDICWRKDKIGYEPPQKKWMENGIIKEKIMSATEKLVSDRILDKSVIDLGAKGHGTSERGNNEWAHLMTSYL
ncbi:MAG: asparagine synthase (glutamine-hydrolyzing) [Bacteroidota bacterium]